MLAKGVLFLVVGLFVGVADKDDQDKTAKALEGKWNVVAGEEGGKKAAASDIKDATVTIRGPRPRPPRTPAAPARSTPTRSCRNGPACTASSSATARCSRG